MTLSLSTEGYLLNGYSLHCSAYQAFIGKEKTFTDDLNKMDHFRSVGKLTGEESLSTEEEGELEKIFLESLRQQTNSELQTKIRLGVPSKRRYRVCHIHDSKEELGLYSKKFVPVSYRIFEKNSKKFASDEERALWSHRVKMIEQILEISQISSLSIIPLDPEEQQTLYCKKSIHYKKPKLWMLEDFCSTEDSTITKETPSEKSPHNLSSTEHSDLNVTEDKEESLKKSHENLFEIEPPAQDLKTVTYSWEELDKAPMSEKLKARFFDISDLLLKPEKEEDFIIESSGGSHPSENPELPDQPAPLQEGFFAPFDDFSSELVHPQYYPNKLPPSVVSVNVFNPDEFELAMKSIESVTREKIRGVINVFIEDFHSSGLGLVLTESPENDSKTMFFKKI